jgi:predicted acetyltransferase
MAIQKLRDMGIDDILLTCAEDNIGSEKTILKHGAIYENMALNDNGENVKRFWIYR